MQLMRTFQLCLPLVLALAPLTASADSSAPPPIPDAFIDFEGNEVELGLNVPGSSGGPSGEGVANPDKSQGCFAANGVEVPCHGFGGQWHAGHSCYVRPKPVQPPLSATVWGGNTDGVIMECRRGGEHEWHLIYDWWQPSASVEPPPDPRVLAERAVETMQLEPIQMGIFPRSLDDDPDALGYVGWNMWLWADQPAPNTWGPISRTATARGYSVTATATVERIEWDMGNGDTITCSAGTPWKKNLVNNEPSPDCGYIYDHLGPYTVTATSHWRVDWEGIGQSGTLELTLSDTRNINVAEIQVVITGYG